MGDERESNGDPQRIKKIAAAAYDYDHDSRWTEYWNNILIPPHMASRSDVVDHYKRKFYQRFIDPDLVVEAMASTSSSQSARPSARTSATEDNTRPRSSTSNTGTTAAAAAAGTTNSLRLDKKTIQFSVDAWVLAMAFLGVLPLVPMALTSKAYQLSLIGKAMLSFHSLYTLYGKPRAWNMPSIQAWLQSVIVAKDFIHFIYCILLVSSQTRFKFALIPVICWSLEHVAKFLRVNFASSLLYRKYLEEFCVWVNANITTLNILSSNAEVALGFLLIFSLLSWQRNILQTFMYWQLLKLMYHVPATAGYHQSVWGKIGRIVTPYIHQYAPFLNSAISAAQRWWFR